MDAEREGTLKDVLDALQEEGRLLLILTASLERSAVVLGGSYQVPGGQVAQPGNPPTPSSLLTELLGAVAVVRTARESLTNQASRIESRIGVPGNGDLRQYDPQRAVTSAGGKVPFSLGGLPLR